MAKKAKHSTSLEKQLLKKESKVCSYGDTVHYAKKPKVFVECDGSFLYDSKHMPYLDLQMWYSAVNLGYKNREVNDAVKKQLDSLPQLACQYLHAEKIQLAESICNTTKKAYGKEGRVHFNVGGSVAVEDSLKLVRKTTGKNLTFAFQGSYHGRTLAATELTSSYRYRRPYGHFSNRSQFIPFPYCFRCPYGKKFDSCGYYCVDQFEKLFETEYYSVWDSKNKESEFAAFYVEAVQGTGGYLIPPPEYFKRLKKILDQYGILMVDDEVQVGMNRTGKFWAMEHFGAKPDVIVFGKALTNGLNPLSGIWAKENLISPDKFPPGSTHSTFSSNTLGTAAALEVMNIYDREKIGQKVLKKGKKYLDMLKRLKKKHKEIGDVSGLGLALRIEVCQRDGYTPNRELTDRIFQAGLAGNLPYKGKKYGLIMDVGGYYKNIFTIAPSFYVTDEEIQMAYELLDILLNVASKQINHSDSMKKSKQSKKSIATDIVKMLKKKGFDAYFVGGCVRDMVLKSKPYDYDIATNAKPYQIEKLFKKTIPVGKSFGVVIVVVHGEQFEVATFRKDLEYKDGRRPEGVSFSDAKSDCLRRDFTVNGLYYDPVKREVVDWVEGVKDIQSKIIRTIGSPTRRFKEDKLRMIRAVRFAANLGFRIEKKTRDVICRMNKQISAVSSERLRDELIKIFTGPHPDRGLDLLDKTGLLKRVLPEIQALKGVQQPKAYHPEGDVYKHTKLMLSFLKKPDVILAFGSLLHDIGKPKTFKRAQDRIRFNGHDKVGARMAEKLLKRLKFSNDMNKKITACVEWHMQFKDAKMMKESTLKRMFQRDTFKTELEQHRADCLASHGDLTIWKFLRKKVKNLSSDQIKPKPFLMGRDLIDMNIPAGPHMGKLLRKADELQLDGFFKSKKAALTWAKKNWKNFLTESK